MPYDPDVELQGYPVNLLHVHEMARKIVSTDMLGTVCYFSFLCGEMPTTEIADVLDRLDRAEYGGPSGAEHWEADVRQAESYLRSLIDLLPCEDVRTAARYLEYLLYAESMDRDTERLERGLAHGRNRLRSCATRRV